MIRSVLALVLLTSSAYAEDIVAYQAEGDAPVSATDPRIMALDEAFASAVNTALGELVDGNTRTSRKGELDKEVVGHARLWVCEVQRDEGRDRRRATPAKRHGAHRPRQASRQAHRARHRDEGHDRARRGHRREDDHGAHEEDAPSALTTVLRGAGFAVRRASPVTGDLTDDQADALAAEAKADNYMIANVNIAPPVAVRGVATNASLVTAELRMFEHRRAHRASDRIAATLGEDQSYAVNHALLAAAARVLPPPPTKLQPARSRASDKPLAEWASCSCACL